MLDMRNVGIIVVIAASVFGRSVAGQCDPWNSLGGRMDDRVNAFTVFNNDLIVGGFFTHNGTQHMKSVAKWDGISWQPLGDGVSNGTYTRVNALTAYNGELVAGGEFNIAGSQNAKNIARWNGTFWQPLGAGLNGDVTALTVFNDGLIASGTFTTAGLLPNGQPQPANHIARWNGSGWQPLRPRFLPRK